MAALETDKLVAHLLYFICIWIQYVQKVFYYCNLNMSAIKELKDTEIGKITLSVVCLKAVMGKNVPMSRLNIRKLSNLLQSIAQ